MYEVSGEGKDKRVWLRAVFNWTGGEEEESYM